MHLRSASALANCHLVMLCHGEEYVSPIVEQPSFSHHVVCRRIHIVVAFSASVRRAPAPEEKDSEQTGLPHLRALLPARSFPVPEEVGFKRFTWKDETAG